MWAFITAHAETIVVLFVILCAVLCYSLIRIAGEDADDLKTLNTGDHPRKKLRN